MAGVWGVVSGKFVLSAAGVILASRIGHDRVQAVIDPAAIITEISPRFAKRLHLVTEGHGTVLPHSLTIGIGAEQFDLSAVRVAKQLPAGTNLRLGQDVLRQHVFAIDLRRNELRLVVPDDYRHSTRDLVAVQASLAADGTMRVPAVLRDAERLDVSLDLANPNAICASRNVISDAYRSLSIGPLQITRKDIRECLVRNSVILGLKAFGSSRLVLDLPHQRLWVASD